MMDKERIIKDKSDKQVQFVEFEKTRTELDNFQDQLKSILGKRPAETQNSPQELKKSLDLFKEDSMLRLDDYFLSDKPVDDLQ